MLLRIMFHDRPIPVNVPDHGYSEDLLEELTDTLVLRLEAAQKQDPAGWDELQTIELEAASGGWKAVLYFSGDKRPAESLPLR